MRSMAIPWGRQRKSRSTFFKAWLDTNRSLQRLRRLGCTEWTNLPTLDSEVT